MGKYKYYANIIKEIKKVINPTIKYQTQLGQYSILYHEIILTFVTPPDVLYPIFGNNTCSLNRYEKYSFVIEIFVSLSGMI